VEPINSTKTRHEYLYLTLISLMSTYGDPFPSIHKHCKRRFSTCFDHIAVKHCKSPKSAYVPRRSISPPEQLPMFQLLCGLHQTRHWPLTSILCELVFLCRCRHLPCPRCGDPACTFGGGVSSSVLSRPPCAFLSGPPLGSLPLPPVGQVNRRWVSVWEVE
jgi:hypothetical protein